MSQPFELIGKWTRGARLAFSYFRGAIAEGKGPSETVTGYHVAGGELRRTEGFRLYHELSGTPPARSALQSTPRTLLLGPTAHIDWPGSMEARYEYVMSYKLVDPVTGQVTPRHMTIATDVRASKTGLEAMATEQLIGKEIRPEYIDITEMQVVEARHRSGDVWEGPAEIVF